ncbi:MAG: TolC family protein [Candidatus Handelsmanbacteria bacterium]|nr:TolC family protein [Candidatus Handelsmanbacteria bacterium]
MSRAGWLWLWLALPALAQEPLSLERAVQLALERNERAQTAQLQAKAAEARVARARAFFFPELTLVGAYTRRAQETVRKVGDDEVTIQKLNVLAPRATATLTLFDPRSLPLYRQARRERDAVQLSASESRRLLGFEAADAFLRTLSAEQVHEAARRRLELAEQSLADARARFAAQLVSSNDVTRAELELATARHQAIRAGGEQEDAYLNLGYLLDAPVAGPLAPPGQLLETASLAPGPPAPFIAEALGARLDLAASQRRAEARAAAASEPLRRLLPSLSANAQYRMTNEGGLSGRTRDWSAGMDLTWNLYDRGELWAERAERGALARIAGLEAQALARRAELEVRTALVAMASQQAASDQAQVAAQVARENAAQIAELYRQGLTSALAVADASARLFEAEVALAREQYSVALAYLDLRSARGLNPVGEESAP